MKFNRITLTSDAFENDANLKGHYDQYLHLLREIEALNLAQASIAKINTDIDELNQSQKDNKTLLQSLKKKTTETIKLVEKELKIVPQNYYKNLWTPLGLSVFGVPFGVTFGLLMKNMAFIGIGLPIGLGIGALLGSYLDKKAEKEGRQLNLNIKSSFNS